jgi:hypothetical protein
MLFVFFGSKSFTMRPLILSFFLLGSLLAGAQKNTPNFEEIPPELGKDNLTLLVMDEDKNAVSKAIYETFEKHYKGPYEIQPRSMVYTKKYADATKYRFLFTVITRDVPGQWIGRERFPPTVDYSYGVFDRRTGKQYKLDGWAGGFKRSMVDYVKRMEEARAGNSK